MVSEATRNHGPRSFGGKATDPQAVWYQLLKITITVGCLTVFAAGCSSGERSENVQVAPATEPPGDGDSTGATDVADLPTSTPITEQPDVSATAATDDGAEAVATRTNRDAVDYINEKFSEWIASHYVETEDGEKNAECAEELGGEELVSVEGDTRYDMSPATLRSDQYPEVLSVCLLEAEHPTSYNGRQDLPMLVTDGSDSGAEKLVFYSEVGAMSFDSFFGTRKDGEYCFAVFNPTRFEGQGFRAYDDEVTFGDGDIATAVNTDGTSPIQGPIENTPKDVGMEPVILPGGTYAGKKVVTPYAFVLEGRCDDPNPIFADLDQ